MLLILANRCHTLASRRRVLEPLEAASLVLHPGEDPVEAMAVRKEFNEAMAQLSFVGDFNAWRTCATRLERDAQGGAWVAQVAMAPGRHRYAFVVDDMQWVADPAALARNGRPASQVVIPSQD